MTPFVDIYYPMEDRVAVGWIFYRSSKYIVFQGLTPEGTCDDLYLQDLLKDEIEISEGTPYLAILERFRRNAISNGFYDPYGMEEIFKTINFDLCTDKTVIEHLLKFAQKRELYVQVLLYDSNGIRDFEDSVVGRVENVDNEVHITPVRTYVDLLEFDPLEQVPLESIFAVSVGSMYLNQLKAAMETKEE